MNLLADIPVSPESLYNFTGIAALLLFIAEKLKNIFGKSPAVPQPMETKEVDECVKRSSYNFHCQANREEHTRIENKLEANIKRLEDRHTELMGDFREVRGTIEANGVTLIQLGQKIDRLLERKSHESN